MGAEPAHHAGVALHTVEAQPAPPEDAVVGYDVRNKLLSIQGGGYELPAEGIVELANDGHLAVAVAVAPAGGRWLFVRDASELMRLRRIRTDRDPATCTFAQLDVVVPAELEGLMGGMNGPR